MSLARHNIVGGKNTDFILHQFITDNFNLKNCFNKEYQAPYALPTAK